MAKCRKCGVDFSEFEETCPYCGTGANIESITEIMDESKAGPDMKEKKKKDKKPWFNFRSSKKEEKTGNICKNCGAEVYDNYEICPKCGFKPSIESLTSILKKTKGE